jgi:hypothetical protein
MDRLHHLKETLPQNIEDNKNYPKIEFVVLNYNSKDEIDRWMLAEMNKHIKSGLVKYYKTELPSQFYRSHAKNIAARGCTGDIVCALDADVFTTPGYAIYVNKQFNKNEDIVIYNFQDDTWGAGGGADKIAVKKEYFYGVGGYNERMKGWGAEDADIVIRLSKKFNLKEISMPKRFVNFIKHDVHERVKNHQNKDVMRSNKENTKIASTSDVVVNSNKNWGYVKDLKLKEFRKDKIKAKTDASMIVLYQNYYHPNDPNRRAEINKVLENNLKNKFIDHICLLCEPGESPPRKHKKLKIFWCPRPTFKDFFSITSIIPTTNTPEKDIVKVVANSDIFFDSTIELMKKIQPYQCFALSRWETKTRRLYNIDYSQDVWCFRDHISVDDCNFQLGLPGCDNRIAQIIADYDYEIFNPSKSIRCWHLHSEETNHSGRNVVEGQYLLLPPRKL